MSVWLHVVKRVCNDLPICRVLGDIVHLIYFTCISLAALGLSYCSKYTYLDEDLALGRAGDVRLLDGDLVVFLGNKSLHFRHSHSCGDCKSFVEVLTRCELFEMKSLHK